MLDPLKIAALLCLWNGTAIGFWCCGNVSTTLQPRRARHGSELPELTRRGLPTGTPT